MSSLPNPLGQPWDRVGIISKHATKRRVQSTPLHLSTPEPRFPRPIHQICRYPDG
jgi:hypothetical protein